MPNNQRPLLQLPVNDTRRRVERTRLDLPLRVIAFLPHEPPDRVVRYIHKMFSCEVILVGPGREKGARRTMIFVEVRPEDDPRLILAGVQRSTEEERRIPEWNIVAIQIKHLFEGRGDDSFRLYLSRAPNESVLSATKHPRRHLLGSFSKYSALCVQVARE